MTNDVTSKIGRMRSLLLAIAMMAMMPMADALKVLMIHNTAEVDAGWNESFLDFWVPYLDELSLDLGFDVSLCEDDLSNVTADPVPKCFADTTDVDVIVVGSSKLNQEIKAAAEEAKIPNIHCSGADPAEWNGVMQPHAFGIQLPWTFYSRDLIHQASSLGLTSLLLLRSSETHFSRSAAAAALEWSRSSGMRVIGPTLAWCNTWSIQTSSCSVRDGHCRCGEQAELDQLGMDYNLFLLPSFYEVSESLVVGSGFDSGGTYLSPALVAFVEGILEDVRAQGADPEVVVNFVTASNHVFKAMQRKTLSYKMYFAGNDLGVESYWSNGTLAVSSADALYHLGAGPWHPESDFTDPFFGTSQQMISRYQQRFGRAPTADAAACVAAGISLTYGLQRYGRSLLNLSTAERRQEIRFALGRLDDETIFGKIRFNRFNQNIGSSSTTLQVLEDGRIRPVLPSSKTRQSLRFPSPTWEVRAGCPPGSYAAATNWTRPVECVLCQEGTFRSTSTPPLEISRCEPCAVLRGRGTLPGERGAVDCPWCPPGRFQNASSGLCIPCPVGTFRAANSSSSVCEACEAHSFADEEGLEVCKPCPNRSSQPDVGQTHCLCDLGSFSETATASSPICLSCDDDLPGSTTLQQNSKSSDACVCPPGTFWHRPSNGSSIAFCKPCSIGLVCAGGRAENSSKHQVPFQAAGYSAGAPSYPGADPPYIVTCTSAIRCPELPIGSCPAGNSGIGCVNCVANHYDDDGICRSCSESPFSVWPLMVAILLSIIALALLYKFATTVDRTSRDSVATILLGAVFVLLIQLGVPNFSKVRVEWVEPLKTLRSVFSFMTFNVDVLRPGCWMSGRSPLMSYLGSLACYPGAALLILGLLAIAKYFKVEVTWNEAINAIGVMLLAFYTALTSLTLRPFKCVGNPDGTASMVYYRNIICWQDDLHWAMVGISMIPFFGAVVAFYALTIWAVLNYASKVARSGGVKYVKRFSFLFGRFNPQHYYFVLILNTRNLLIAVTPVLLQMYNELLFIFFTFTLTLYALLQAHICPWRTQLSNLLDAGTSPGMSCFLVAAVAIGITLLDFDVKRQTIIVQIMSMLSTLCFLTLFLALLCYSAYRAYRPSRTYGIFLSHHKLGAAVLARWFKMMLNEYVTDRIFLDSDDVSKLDAILDVTSWDTENVVVLMTSETMKRMWCAAEVASAWDSGTKLVLVSCDGNRITRGLIEEIPELWSEQQKATLFSTGVHIDMIVDAYKDLLTAPVIPLVRNGARIDPHHDVVKEVISQCRGLSRQVLSRLTLHVQRSASFSAPQNAIYLIGDVQTPEPGCVCRVIQTMLQASLQEMVNVINPVQAVLDLATLSTSWEGAKVILVVLTNGVLQDPTFAAAMAVCSESKWGVLVPVKADEQFAYPDPSFFESLHQGKIFSAEVLEAMNTDFRRVERIYRTIFNVLALKFTAHGSAHILSTEILVLKGRLMPLLMDSPELIRMESEKRILKLRQMSFVRSEASDTGVARASRKQGRMDRRWDKIFFCESFDGYNEL
eukprot:s2299_g2.t2